MNHRKNQTTDSSSNGGSMLGVLMLVIVAGIAWAFWDTFAK
ncbi:MAG: hypothetical protein AAB447_01660 [Patescibacteria group bacterium]